MAEKHKVSVIVPVFNSEVTIEKCLNSISRQTYRNMEIIVVNDGSADGSLEKIKRLGKEDGRIKIIDKKIREGVGMARNAGLDCAKGDYIAFVDADDYIEHNYVEILYNALFQFGADISLCWPQGEFPNGQIDVDEREEKTVPECFSVWEGYSYATCRNHRVVWGSLFKKPVVQNIRFASDLYVGEDTLFFAMAAKQCKKIVHTYLNLYHYVQYEESAYHGKFSKERYTELEAWDRVCGIFQDLPAVYPSAKCEYASVCFEMMKRYYGDALFQKEYYKEVLKEYRRNVRFFFRDKDITIPQKAFRSLAAVFPGIFMKYW